MKKKLFFAFGPLIIAVIIVGIIFLTPANSAITNNKVLEQASSSMADTVIQGSDLTKSALKQSEYIPFFGSSELSRFSPFHPSVLSYKYDRDYTPFLIGAPGTQSLMHYAIMNNSQQALTNKKMVFIISPQWFVENGVKEDYFAAHFSKLQLYHWMMHTKKVTAYEQYYAKRLLQFENIQNSPTMKENLQQIMHGTALSEKQVRDLKLEYRVLNREDRLFGTMNMRASNNLSKIHDFENMLPTTENQQEWLALANELGAKETSSNDLGISNDFYNKNLKDRIETLKDKQQNLDYTKGPEFADFQLVLNQIAAQNADVLFIIPPINEKWSDYTGLSQEMVQQFATKITTQLNEQGFYHVADFTKKSAEPYFMQDTIHLGWRGWIDVDKALQSFIKDTTKPQYQMDDNYLSEAWQQQ